MVAVIGMLAFAICLFLFIGNGGYTWRTRGSVDKAIVISTDRPIFIVNSCNKNPEVSLVAAVGQQGAGRGARRVPPISTS